MVRMALGSDTGGSIRCPAAFCGIVGLKPTYGRVSRYGLIGYANSLDQIGPMAMTVEDVSLLMEVLTASDPRDSTSISCPYHHTPDPSVTGLKIGVPEEFFGEGVDPQVATVVWNAITRLESDGAEIVACRMPSMAFALAACYVICMSEASSNLARFDGVRYGPPADIKQPWQKAYQEQRKAGFGTEVRRRIMLGTFALSSGYYGRYYAKAQAARQQVREDFARLFQTVDVIAGPTMPTVAYRIGEKNDPLSMYLSDTLTVPASLAGVPAISVPCGTQGGLPIGLQVMGPWFRDEKVIDVAAAYEQGGIA
jgi:aspartyl-tRNA(Asn)/glutamyl-tRNA(Gln) amidotransferase subunit A